MKEKNQRHWEVWDYGFAEAAAKLASEVCRKCGTEAWHAHSENNVIDFEIVEHNCYGCAHLEEVESKKSDKAKKKFGVTEQVRAKNVFEDEELPGRADWLKEIFSH